MMSAFFSYRQLKRSFYIFFFQTPLAETAVSLESYAFLDSLWADWSPGYGAGYDLAKVKESIGSSANLQAAISYYRAMFDPAQHDPSYADAQLASGAIPEQPLLYLHGQNDGCMGAEVVSGIAEQLPAGSRFEVISDAGHFLHLERPEVVNPLLIDFLLEG
jgi:pimeloyl-ACP methyl ester carboxylesterase